MFLSAETMRVIMGLGLSSEQVIELYAALERDFRSMETPKGEPSLVDRKRQRDRERMAAKRAAERATPGDIRSDTPERQSRDSLGDPGATVASDIGATEPPSRVREVDSSLPLGGDITPLTHPSGASPQPEKRRKQRFVPVSWHPSESHFAKARELGLSDDQFTIELAKFREWEFKDGKTDFDRAFHRWLREAVKRQEEKTDAERTRAARWGFDRDRKVSNMLQGTMDFAHRGRGQR